MTWGISPWGLTPWGLGLDTAFTMVSAYPVAETIVRVTLSRAARAASSIVVGDALNPRSWVLVGDDSGLSYTVLSVRSVGMPESGTVFELLLLQKLGPWGKTHTLSAPYLVTPAGVPLGSPSTMSVQGCVAVQAPLPFRSMEDFAKPQLGDGLDGAVFRVGTSGDYDTDSGPTLLRKLFFRRISSTPGSFFHLTNYGLGIKVKSPITNSELAALRADAQDQLRREPEVDIAEVSVRRGSNGTLYLMLRARLRKTGAVVTDNIPIVPPGTGVSL